MQVTILNRITSLILSVMVVFSTFSFTVEKHYCGDSLVDMSVFSEVQKCGMDLSEAVALDKSCCKDEVDVVKGQDDLKITTEKELSSSQVVFFKSFVFSFEALFESLSKQIIPHKDYSAPNLVAEIHVLHETFLI
ncbi:HYC_CC_PP family protein [Winogradskyella ursingii]|uniref:HYC_CC_PP family protein n=1 Tax=Winogradskyella ursingii TaxID=2686079 RepID=UPI0015C962D5|nr:hypothetical protein [Winogradskyella ursingii]